MKNTVCSTCSEAGPVSRRLRVMGVEFPVRDAVCRLNGGPPTPSREKIKLQLSVCLTAWCGCACPFCIAGNTDGRDSVTLASLERVLAALKKEDVVRGVSFTGGEPFTDVQKLDAAVHLAFEIFGHDLEISISTNGSGLERLGEIRDLVHVDAVHVSRHHYDDARNRGLFGGGVPTAAELRRAVRSISFPDLFVFNCMLLKDYIGTPEEARRFMDFALDVGVPKVGFITGTPVNDFVRAQAVAFETVLRRDDPALLFTRGYTDSVWCHCQDGVYCSDDGRLLEFYGRSTQAMDCPYARGLVYGADDTLRAGYGNSTVIWRGEKRSEG